MKVQSKVQLEIELEDLQKKQVDLMTKVGAQQRIERAIQQEITTVKKSQEEKKQAVNEQVKRLTVLNEQVKKSLVDRKEGANTLLSKQQAEFEHNVKLAAPLTSNYQKGWDTQNIRKEYQTDKDKKTAKLESDRVLTEALDNNVYQNTMILGLLFIASVGFLLSV